MAAPLPLVVVLHGAFSTARKMEKETGFTRLADRERFYVAYPNGIGVFGLLQHWNAGHCCGKAAKDGIDDVGFVQQVIEHAARTVDVDRRRVYVVGFSNGGMLAYRFAAERSSLVAAAAALGASIGGRKDARTPEWRIPSPERPMPIIVFHGLADENVPFAGGRSSVKGGEREYVSVEESVAFWVRADGCSPDPAQEALNGGWVAVSSCSRGPEDSGVVLYSLRDWGHRWPGRFFTERLAAEHPLRNFDAAEIIWSFFKRHSRPAPASSL